MRNSRENKVSSKPKKEPEQDTLLFGSTASLIADEFSQSIDTALVEGISSLPLFSSNQDDDDDDSDDDDEKYRLLESFRKAYFRNVDRLEMYTARSIFSIQMFIPKKRQFIVRQFHDDTAVDATQQQALVSTMSESSENTSKSNEDRGITPFDFPPKKDIPSQEQVDVLKSEIRDVRAKLRSLRMQRNELFMKCNSMNTAEKTSEMAKQHIGNHNVEAVRGSFVATMESTKRLDQLNEKGKELTERMDNEKRTRAEEEYDAMELRTAKKMTLEERYKTQKETCQTSAASLNAVRGLFQRPHVS